MKLSKLLMPSLLGAPKLQLGQAIEQLDLKITPQLHIDVMDGHFVPNLAFDAAVVKEIKKQFPALRLDVHLMVQRPESFFENFILAGADALTFHVEAAVHHDRLLHTLKERHILAGLALVPSTPIQSIQHLLPLVDIVLLMSVNPGFGGQTFIPYVLEKVHALKALKKEKNYHFALSIDGGIHSSNLIEVYNAGCDWLIAGSAFFDPLEGPKLLNAWSAKDSSYGD